MEEFNKNINNNLRIKAEVAREVAQKRVQLIIEHFELFDKILQNNFLNIETHFIEQPPFCGVFDNLEFNKYTIELRHPIIVMNLGKYNYSYSYIENVEISNEENTFYRNIFNNTTEAIVILTDHVKRILGDDYSIIFSLEGHKFNLYLKIKKTYIYKQ